MDVRSIAALILAVPGSPVKWITVPSPASMPWWVYVPLLT